MLRAKAQLHIVIGSTRLAAQAFDDFRRELERELKEHGSIGPGFFENVSAMLDEELERLDAAESLLDEEVQAVLP